MIRMITSNYIWTPRSQCCEWLSLRSEPNSNHGTTNLFGHVFYNNAQSTYSIKKGRLQRLKVSFQLSLASHGLCWVVWAHGVVCLGMGDGQTTNCSQGEERDQD